MWPRGRSVQCHGGEWVMMWTLTGTRGPPTSWPRYDAGPVTGCQCQHSLMSVPGGQVRRHPVLLPVTRGGSHSPDVDFVSSIKWHKPGLGAPLQFQVFTGHRKGKGDAALYCVPRPLIGQECHQSLLIGWCLMWAPNMGHWPITRHYLTLHITLITIISPWHNCHQSVQTLPCIGIIMTSNEWS